MWLDSKKTSPYEFYQFWLNVSDESVIDYLKLFTLLSLQDISAIERDNLANPSARAAQRILAREITTLVHGEGSAGAAEQVTNVLFGGGELSSLNEIEKKTLLENAPTHNVSKDTLLIDVLVEAGLATSKREARTFVESGAATLGDKKIEDTEVQITQKDFAAGLAILKRGKKQMVVLIWEQ